MKKKFLTIPAALAFIGILFYSNCTYDKGIALGGSGYPSNIEGIVLRKCATAGCHNTKSKAAAGGLDLSTWEHLFEGSNNGTSVIPYQADQSYLMYFINTFNDLGIHLLPVMPNGETPLSHAEVVAFRDWINNGAANSSGFVKWSDNPARKKIYIIDQGCKLVSIMDRATHLVMRVVDVGDGSNSSPHEIKVSPDNRFWYVIFASGNMVEKFDAATDQLIANMPIPANISSWNSSAITEDGKYQFVVDYEGYGKLACMDLQNDTCIAVYQFPSGGFNSPHGSALNSTGKKLYISGLSGNYYYKLDVTDPANINPIDFITPHSLNGLPPNSTSSLNSYSIEFSPDGSRYYISCQGSNEVRVMNAATDTLMAVIPVGIYPSEFAFSDVRNYLFVTCTEDTVTFPGLRGSVYVINCATNTVIAKVYPGWQPHGIAVDDELGMVYVVNRNVDSKGPAPHHSTNCGRNGYMTVIDMNTMKLIPRLKTEVSSDPYDISIRY